jgi:hypothetical protein
MDMLTRPQGISLPLAPVMAGSIGFGIAIVIGTLPAPLFEDMVMASGLPALLSAAEPPLGLTARALVTISLGLLIAAIAQVPLSWLYGRRRVRIKTPKAVSHIKVHNIGAEWARAASPKPRPIVAHEELGAPFLSVNAGSPAPEPAPALLAKPAPTKQQRAAEPQRVTDMVEMLDGIFIPDRRRRPRNAHFKDPIFDAEPTVSNLIKRLERAVASDQLGPLGRRPLDPGFCEAVERLSGLRKAS